MLQFIVQFLPLIFLCAAFGIVLLNFGSVAEYIIYVISMLVQPKEFANLTSTVAPLPPPTPENKRKFSFKRPFIRIWTLFLVLFFPNVDIEKMSTKSTLTEDQENTTFYSEKAQEEINKYRIKTYSTPSSNTTNFRSALDPVAPLSPTFQQAFPDVANIINKITQTEERFISRHIPKPSFPTEEPPNTITNLTHNENLTSNSNSAEKRPEKFDALASLEKKVNDLTKNNTQENIHKVNYSQLTKKISEINNNGKTITVSLSTPQTLPKLSTESTSIGQQEIHVFGVNKEKNASKILPLVGSIITYTILSIPIIMVVGSLLYFIVLNGFNLTQIDSYPKWVSSLIESFVKTYILKNQ